MNHKEQIPKPEESLEELDMDTTGSVDDFIKQLEEKEKDLHITADLTIEIQQSEYDPRNAPAFVPEPTAAVPTATQQVSVGAKTRIYELEQEVDSLKKRLSGLREERNEVQEKSDRRLKDFENYKYRMDRERRGAFIDQISNLASQMLPVLDNLERAISSVGGLKDKKSDEFQQFYDGIGLVHHQVNEIFSDMGVQPIATVGETFDPNFHEAVAIEEDSTEPPNTITGEMLRGYRIGNRVIRHSMVKVTAGAAPVKKESAPEPAVSAEETAPPIPAPEESLPDPADIFDLDETLTEKD
ncbi:MAG TPA: nucleotide exchange factor GrpE [Pyrinomonadaceae bacterium]|nr:nucleotide exchange factor GrpE [Pyrinomonadaceae bacterium]